MLFFSKGRVPVELKNTRGPGIPLCSALPGNVLMVMMINRAAQQERLVHTVDRCSSSSDSLLPSARPAGLPHAQPATAWQVLVEPDLNLAEMNLGELAVGVGKLQSD